MVIVMGMEWLTAVDVVPPAIVKLEIPVGVPPTVPVEADGPEEQPESGRMRTAAKSIRMPMDFASRRREAKGRKQSRRLAKIDPETWNLEKGAGVNAAVVGAMVAMVS